MSPRIADSEVKKPRLIVVSAPSGAGKTTLCEMLLKEFPQIALSISTTTRAKRPNEQHGVHYWYVSPTEFQDKVKRGDFAEWAKVHGERYGTSKQTIEQALGQNKHVLFDIDVQGAMSLQKAYQSRVLLLFIHPPSVEELQKRLVARRGDSTTSIETRLQNAYNELAWSAKFDYQILNDNLSRAYQELKQIVTKECL